MNLRQIAKPHSVFNGAVTFWFLPHRGVVLDRYLRTLIDAYGPAEQWDDTLKQFALSVPLTTDIDFGQTEDAQLAEEIELLRQFWQEKPPDVLACFGLFELLMTHRIMSAWEDGYHATRRTILSAPEVLQSAPDPEASPEEKKDAPPPSSTSSNSPKRKPKRMSIGSLTAN